MKKIAIFFKNSQSKRCLRACSSGELARLHGLARLGEVIFIPRSYGIFYLTAKSLLRHRKKIVLITWLLYFQYGFQKATAISFYCIQYYEYDHCLFYSFATSWDSP